MTAWKNTVPSRDALHEAKREALLREDHAQVVQERDRFEHALRDLVREGVADGSIVPCEPKLAVFAILGALNWVPKWFRQDGDWSARDLTAAFAELFDRALSSRPAAALTTRIGAAAPPRRRGAPSPLV